MGKECKGGGNSAHEPGEDTLRGVHGELLIAAPRESMSEFCLSFPRMSFLTIRGRAFSPSLPFPDCGILSLTMAKLYRLPLDHVCARLLFVSNGEEIEYE